MDNSSVRIELDRERCLAGAARTPGSDGPYVAGPAAPQPRIAPPGPPINGTREEPRFAIFNRTGEGLSALHWKASTSSDWGDNRLDDGATLSPTQFCTARVIRPAEAMAQPCRFDLRAITASGRAVDLTEVDVCAVSRVTFD